MKEATLNRTIYITKEDMVRLRSLIQAMESQEDLNGLREELERAQIVGSNEVPPDVITMNSQARLKDLEDGEEMTYTLVFPERANIDHGRISVLAPVGTAMLGVREGEVVEWSVPAGQVRLQVLKVLYQPEAAKQYTL